MPEAIRPIQKLEDDIAPARLMLRVHRLLDCQDTILTEGALVERLRELIEAASSEELMVLQNELFVGLVRERAAMRARDLKSATLGHLLRQAVVLSCTALDIYLPALLTEHMPDAVRVRGRSLLADDAQVRGYLKDLTFSVEEVLRATSEDGSIYIANKILSFIKFKYLAGVGGIAVACRLVGIEQPWSKLAENLGRDERDLKTTIRGATERRNDIVHRGDRDPDQPEGGPRSIGFAWAHQAVETIASVCHALDEVVEAHMRALRKEAA